MARSKKVEINIRKQGQHFALVVEDELVALTVHRKNAVVLQNLLGNCIKYSSRKLFREGLKDALLAKEAVEKAPEAEMPQKADKGSTAKGTSKTKAKASKKPTAADSPVQPENADTLSQGSENQPA